MCSAYSVSVVLNHSAIPRRSRASIVMVLATALVLHLSMANCLKATSTDNAQLEDDSSKQANCEIQDEVHISLDNTGIGTHGALNPRSPYPLVQPKSRGSDVKDCYAKLQDVRLIFDNLTDRFIGVQLVINLKVGSQWGSQLRDLALQLRIDEVSKKIGPEEYKKGLDWIDACSKEVSTFDPIKKTLTQCATPSKGSSGTSVGNSGAI